MSQPVTSLFAGVPETLRIADARARIRALNREHGISLVVLDDDPTGCQTVFDIPALLSWDPTLLAETMARHKFFYILTNSRAQSEERALALNREVIGRIASRTDLTCLRVVSRSDSTLRGHFPAETDALAETLGPVDGTLLVPFFREGGRLTVNDTHYVVQEGGDPVPAHETEFARDPVFGYRNSFLPAWVAEKSGGRWREEDAISLSLEAIRGGGPDRIAEILGGARNNRPIILNALEDADLEVVVLGLCQAEALGKRFLYRTGASFVKVRAGLEDRPLYRPPAPGKRGLVVVGSYVDKTTRQLAYLLENAAVSPLEVRIETILQPDNAKARRRLVQEVDALLRRDETVVIYTERQYHASSDRDRQLAEGRRISDYLSDTVSELRERPDYIVAKGGITSHDVAARGLGVRCATVLGQIQPGVPIWRCDAKSRFPDLLYVVYPGNVGGVDGLVRVVSSLQG